MKWEPNGGIGLIMWSSLGLNCEILVKPLAKDVQCPCSKMNSIISLQSVVIDQLM